MKRLAISALLLALGASFCGDRSGRQRVVIQHKGSDTLLNVAQAWAENYKAVNSDVAVAVSGGGSGTGISAIINGTGDIASASRKMKAQEIDAARRNGAEPVEFVAGYDAIAVVVHSDNPLDSFTFEQLAAIYAEEGEVDSWSQLGVEVPGCKNGEIVRVSRQSNSGTFIYFKEAVLGDGRDYKLGSRDMHGSKDVVELVSKTPCAIGYTSIAYAIPEIRMPCIAVDGGSPCVLPSTETVIDGTYPIARTLMLYTREQPEGVIKEYLDWILSDEGQCIVQGKQYAPVRAVECP